jgi:hypothetical protein
VIWKKNATNGKIWCNERKKSLDFDPANWCRSYLFKMG